ncbi:MAG TPA: SdrD B-like domain-containing protein, partial [Candidatus Hydrogenedentes bacterium]|nr:SdrD B-like domain-containing protein [Candidatus Hydrogenedentota bacterium]
MKDTYWIINPATAKASLTGYSSLNPIQTTPAGTETDFESVACYSDDLAISATDNAVTALKGFIGDLVWSDLNGDGNFDPSYAIIGGRIDIQNDGGEGGVINGNDDGVIGSIAVINGYLDLDGDGVTDGDDGDDGVFQGHTVLNGVLQTGTTVVAEQGIPNVRVYVDEDNDGVFDWTDTNGNGIWDAGEGERWEYTDASGLYAIYGMVSGAYTVRYDQSTTPSGYVPTTPVSHLATLATDVTQYADADFGLRPPLSPAVDSAIGDQVWIDRNEDGVFDTGEPVLKDISVYLYLDRGTIGVLDAADIRIATDVTDAEGKYLFTGLSEDTYLVKVDETDPQFPSGLALVSASPAQPNPESVTLGTLQDKLDVDFAYNYTSSIGDLVWYDNNGNGLYEPALGENGVAGAYAMLYEDTNGNGVFDGDIDVQIGGTTTAADGSYLLDNLPPGTYFVQVYEQSVRPEGCPTCVPNLMPTTATKVKVDLDPNEAYVDADFGYKQGSIIMGSVFWDVNHNTVFEPQYPGAPEQGLGGITVWIDSDGNGVLDWTDADSDGVWDEGEGEQWTVTES